MILHSTTLHKCKLVTWYSTQMQEHQRFYRISAV